MKSPSSPLDRPGRPKSAGRKILPLAIAASFLAHGLFHPKVEEGANYVEEEIHDVHAKIQKSMEENDIDENLTALQTKVPAHKIAKLKQDRLESEGDKKEAEQRFKQREVDGKKLLKYIYDHYDTMDVKEVLWQLEYNFQGVKDEDYKEAHAVLLAKLATMDLEGQSKPNPADLKKFHQTFVPQGPKNDVKSSAVEFLASHLDSQFLNCEAVAKTLVLALLTKYPELRNSLYFQFFNHHVRLLVDLNGQKYIFKLGQVVPFPDAVTEAQHNAVVPVDVYYGLTANRKGEPLLKRIQYFGLPKDPGEIDIPAFTNSNIPGFALPEGLGAYTDPEVAGDDKASEELKKVKSDLEMEKALLKKDAVLVIPALTDEEKKVLQAFEKNNIFLCLNASDTCITPYPILIKMDQVSLSDLKNLAQNPAMGNAKIIFTGLKKMDDQTLNFIVENFPLNELAFEDLEEITALQLAKLFENDKDWKKEVEFFSLKYVRGAPPPSTFFDLNDLLLSEKGPDIINTQKQTGENANQPAVQYMKMGLTFHCLNDMAQEATTWLAHRSGKVNFKHESNLTAPVAEGFASFEGDMTVSNPLAVSLVQGLKKRHKTLLYQGADFSEDMAQALVDYEGEVVVKVEKYSPSLETLVKKTGPLEVDISRQANQAQRLAIFKAIGKKVGYLIIGRDHLTPEESTALKDHDGDLRIIFDANSEEDLKNIIKNLATNRGKLALNYSIVQRIEDPVTHDIKTIYYLNNINSMYLNAIGALRERHHPTEFITLESSEIVHIKGFKAPVIAHCYNKDLNTFLTGQNIRMLSSNNTFVTLKVSENETFDSKLLTLAPNVKIEKEDQFWMFL
jgi:hypothetical protein